MFSLLVFKQNMTKQVYGFSKKNKKIHLIVSLEKLAILGFMRKLSMKQ